MAPVPHQGARRHPRAMAHLPRQLPRLPRRRRPGHVRDAATDEPQHAVRPTWLSDRRTAGTMTSFGKLRVSAATARKVDPGANPLAQLSGPNRRRLVADLTVTEQWGDLAWLLRQETREGA